LLRSTFRSLRIYNYRVWAMGALVSNVGTWMQRIAQDWIVLTELTNRNATAVGIVMALQFGPQVALLPLTGYAADHFDRRRLLLVTQVSMGVLALGLGLLMLSGAAQLWHVYVFALLLGCVSAFDAPARQTFVAELVGEADLANAVALNSTSFNAGRLIGPAVAGVLIARVGSGLVFVLNAVSFAAVLLSLRLLHVDELHASPHHGSRGTLTDGFRYVWRRPDLKAILLMVLLIGAFALNFPIFISTMSVTEFGMGASEYGVLTSMTAVGAIAGALLSARQDRPRFGPLFVDSLCMGIGLGLAAMAGSYWLFGAVLLLTGIFSQAVTTSMLSTMQMATAPHLRGRVMAILLAVALGGTSAGAPLVGWVADRFGPRAALALGAASGLAGAGIVVYYLARHRHLRIGIENGRPRFSVDPAAILSPPVASETPAAAADLPV
jgi:MFS family permease